MKIEGTAQLYLWRRYEEVPEFKKCSRDHSPNQIRIFSRNWMTVDRDMEINHFQNDDYPPS